MILATTMAPVDLSRLIVAPFRIVKGRWINNRQRGFTTRQTGFLIESHFIPVRVIKMGGFQSASTQHTNHWKRLSKSALCSTDVTDVEQITLERACYVDEYNQLMGVTLLSGKQ